MIGFPLTVPLFICFYLRFESGVSSLPTIASNGNHLGLCFTRLFQRLVHLQFEQGALCKLGSACKPGESA